MSLKVSLVEALIDAEFVAIDGYELEQVRRSDKVIEVELADESWRSFPHQEITLDNDGQGTARDVNGVEVSCLFQTKVAYTGGNVSRAGKDSQGVMVKVSLDGGVTFVEATQGVRVVYENVDVPGEDGSAQVHITLSEEGVVRDVWGLRASPPDQNLGTSSQTLSEMIEQLVGEVA